MITYLLFPLMCSLLDPDIKSLERETFSRSLLGSARIVEPADRELLSDLLTPLALLEDPDLWKMKYYEHILFHFHSRNENKYKKAASQTDKQRQRENNQTSTAASGKNVRKYLICKEV